MFFFLLVLSILIVIFFLSIIAFLTILFISGISDYNLIISFMSIVVSFLLIGILFYTVTNKYPLNDVAEYWDDEFNQLFVKGNDCKIIYFTKKDGLWVCENGKKTITLDLTDYAFQKSYLISFVIRNLRYKLIHNKLPLKNFFRNSFTIKNGLNVKIIIVEGNKQFEKMIVKNGVSKYGFIAKNITFSPYFAYGFNNIAYSKLMKSPTFIDERIYQKQRLGNKNRP